MATFEIDFFELAFLAEACIPPNPIARTMFWQHLTDKYWAQMSEDQREHLFEWLNKNDRYQESLEKEEETQLFHARFDPNNQYVVKTTNKGKAEVHEAFKLGEFYYIKRNTWISPEYIDKVEKKDSELQPIHKFNNGRGATLCNVCGVIIVEALTDDLKCHKCKSAQQKP